MQPSRYALMEKRAASDQVRGVSWPEVESIAREHIVKPQDIGDDKQLTALLEAHPYLASDLGLLLIDRAAARRMTSWENCQAPRRSRRRRPV